MSAVRTFNLMICNILWMAQFMLLECVQFVCCWKPAFFLCTANFAMSIVPCYA